jgi:alkylation response protein AidB-like acyl-CoA dehydrogenase
MLWELSDEEKLLRTAAEDFFKKKMPINLLRELRADPSRYPSLMRELWQEMAHMGWSGILIPETYGGLAFGYRGLGIIMEAAGRTLAPTPLLASVACAGALIETLGDATQKQELLPALAEGRSLMTVAHEESERFGSGVFKTRATREREGYKLQGEKAMVIDGSIADGFLVLAALPAGGQAWFTVDRREAGVQLKTFQLLDGRPACQLILNQVHVSARARLGGEMARETAQDRLLDSASVCLSAEMLGAAAEAFQMTLGYLKQRVQFGVPIGSFQALQHRMAQMYSELELCQTVVQRALTALDRGEAQKSALASLAKAKTAEVFQHVAREAIQLHGGIGMTDEHNIGFYLKRARIDAEWFGSPAFHRDRYARLHGF